jgi:hypothetical protein
VLYFRMSCIKEPSTGWLECCSCSLSFFVLMHAAGQLLDLQVHWVVCLKDSLDDRNVRCARRWWCYAYLSSIAVVVVPLLLLLIVLLAGRKRLQATCTFQWLRFYINYHISACDVLGWRLWRHHLHDFQTNIGLTSVERKIMPGA